MRILILLFSFLLTVLVYCQGDVGYSNYTTKNGLESNTIFSIYQDALGYLYIGHNKGLNKFNGKTFLTITSTQKAKAQSNFVPYKNGIILCRDFYGNSYKIKNDSLLSFDFGFKESWGFSTFVRGDDGIYVFQNNQFAKLDSNGNSQTILLPHVNEGNRIWSLVVEKNHVHYCVTSTESKYLISYDLSNKTIIRQKPIHEESQIQLFNLKEKIVWADLHTGDIGLVEDEYPIKLNLFQTIGSAELKITDLIELPDDRILISSFDGLFLFDSNFNYETHFLRGIQCTEMLLDKDETLWVGSLQNGLFQIPSLDIFFIPASTTTGVNVKFSKIIMHNGHIFAGSYDGRIFEFDKNGVLIQTIQLNQAAEIQSMTFENNSLWAYCSGLFQINYLTSEFEIIPGATATKSICVYNDTVVLSTSKGLMIKTKESQRSYFDSLWFKNCYHLPNGSLITETSSNIFMFNPQLNEHKILMKEGSDLCKFKEELYFKLDDKIYVVNEDESVSKIFNLDSTPSRLLANSNGLFFINQSEKIQQLLPNSNWTAQIPFEFSLKEALIFTGIDSLYVIGNPEGLLFIPSNIIKQQSNPILILLNEKGNHDKSEATYILPYATNELVFSFDLLPNLVDRGKGIVLYRIPEIDSSWSTAVESDHYSIELLRLPSGNYTLEVRGCNLDNSFTETMIFKIRVQSPIYLRWWFIIGLILTFLLMSWGIFKWRANLIRQKTKRQLEHQRLQMRALNSELVAIRAQMNPHFIFNSLSSIQTKILNEDRLGAYENLSTFAVLLRQALQFTSQEFITLENEMDFIRNYISLEQNRNKSAFTYNEKIASNIQLKSEKVPSLILQPFVENAIRHGLMHQKSPRVLSIEIEKNNGLRISIQDNGIGRLASSKLNQNQHPDHKSFATRAIADRIEMLSESGKMAINLTINDLSTGTEVIIIIAPNEH